LIIFGVLAIVLPIATSIGVAIVIGWLVVFDGLAQLVHAFQSEGAGHIVWKLVVALLYIFAGAYLVGHTALGAAGLTFVLGIFLFAEGVADVAARSHQFDGHTGLENCIQDANRGVPGTRRYWTIEDEQCQRVGGGYAAAKFGFLLFL
jgi:uncharacterized membrane protein HdeD (DUF308 family)